MFAPQHSAFAPGSLVRSGRTFLNEEFRGVIAAPDTQRLDAEIRTFALTTGFDRYCAVVLRDDFSRKDSCEILSSLNNTPPAYFDEWMSFDWARKDPVMQQAKRAYAPILYGQDSYAAGDDMEMWERQAPFGYANGIVTTFHLPNDLHVSFGVDRRSPLPRYRAELLELVAQVQLFGTFVQCAALSLLDIRADVQQAPLGPIRLSPREYECLQWAAEGKTAWETGMLLSIAEGSVAKVLASAIRRLGCVTKPQAVVKALRLGLIH